MALEADTHQPGASTNPHLAMAMPYLMSQRSRALASFRAGPNNDGSLKYGLLGQPAPAAAKPSVDPNKPRPSSGEAFGGAFSGAGAGFSGLTEIASGIKGSPSAPKPGARLAGTGGDAGPDMAPHKMKNVGDAGETGKGSGQQPPLVIHHSEGDEITVESLKRAPKKLRELAAAFPDCKTFTALDAKINELNHKKKHTPGAGYEGDDVALAAKKTGGEHEGTAVAQVAKNIKTHEQHPHLAARFDGPKPFGTMG